ncbi:MAG: hypothetical protein OXC15_03405 [Rhodospirillaceae bacterium]|nr:hypothetical protein [Rhodospirillaceae bacterium]
MLADEFDCTDARRVRLSLVAGIRLTLETAQHVIGRDLGTLGLLGLKRRDALLNVGFCKFSLARCRAVFAL